MPDVAALIREHHTDLQAWLRNGDPTAYERFLARHDSTFVLISTDGEILRLPELQAALAGAGGNAPDLTIEITDVEHVTSEVARFVETHHTHRARTTRIVTAIVRDGTWLAVQETSAAA
ncbi:MAG: DUF4440 domain-containing protein [Actinomycetia bacterium]|nr:DUF4440 domain-containing protein [Actinomycetes bacterium]